MGRCWILLEQHVLSGLLFIFFITFVSNATPFFGVSYTLVSTAFLLAVGANPLTFLAVVLVTGVGAAAAKSVMYYGALGFGPKLRTNRNIRLLSAWMSRRSFLVALFVAAFVPVLPLDDYIYIGAGANRAKLSVMLAVTLAAKIAKSAFEISLELLGIIKVSGVLEFFGISGFELSIILTVFFLVLGVVVYKVDWEKVLRALKIRVDWGRSERKEPLEH